MELIQASMSQRVLPKFQKSFQDSFCSTFSGGDEFCKVPTGSTQAPSDDDENPSNDFYLSFADGDEDPSGWTQAQEDDEEDDSSPEDSSKLTGLRSKVISSDKTTTVSTDRGAPSLGSELHGTGECRPCAWFFKAQGCQNGRECLHCHLCPKQAVKARKKARAREHKVAERQLKEHEKQRRDAEKQQLQAEQEELEANFLWRRRISPSDQGHAWLGCATAPGHVENVMKEHITPESAAVQASNGFVDNDNGAKTTFVSRLPEVLPCFSPPPGLAPPPGLSHQSSEGIVEAEVGGGGAAADLSVPGEPVKVFASFTVKDDADKKASADDPSKQRLLSVGSALHESGDCKPCAWFWRASGCQNADSCMHCHLCPPGAMKSRKKSKAEPCKREAAHGDLRRLPTLMGSVGPQLSATLKAKGNAVAEVSQAQQQLVDQQNLIAQQQLQLEQLTRALQMQREQMSIMARSQMVLFSQVASSPFPL
eukprot:TRINITY_DN67726_c0_g1_i1.p1 TRINITY_DN67726_c0_g1~~TRINITY_DN67726_c0_g1_i1.p1  ORF type:complete len:480 (+),score=120.95 TRINITY_DN67726_c0_g1_i1:136-1575(+)